MIVKKFILSYFFVSVIFLEAQVPSEIPTAGLQGYWSFTGNARDVSSYERHGTPYNVSLVEDRFNNENSAYSFNGVSSFISTGYVGILGPHPRVISFWALVRKTKSGQVAISWGNNNQFPNYGGRFDCCFGRGFTEEELKEDFTGATIDVSDAGVTYEGQEEVTDGKWHHYVYQFNKKYLKDVEIYQDGLLLTHEPYRFYENCLVNTKPEINVTFGALFLPTDTICFLTGHLDDIAIYDRALSTAEIQALYTAPDPKGKTDYTKWIPVLLIVVLLALLITWLIRLRIKNVIRREKEKINLEKKWYEQENRVLKAQMDPHFIFNSLNTIQQFIIVEDNEKAQLYLSTFAQLIRMQLESNTNESILMKLELEILGKYLEIESLRFNNAIDYEIVVAPEIDTNQIYIPCFLVQPFIENALYHGLLPKMGYKELDVIFKKIDDKALLCIVEDNGIGRQNAGTHKSFYKKKSLGVNFVQQRLLIMSKMDNYHYSVETIDKTDEAGNSTGTRIEIKMPILTH